MTKKTTEAPDATADTAGKDHGDFKKAWRAAKKQMRANDRDLHDSMIGKSFEKPKTLAEKEAHELRLHPPTDAAVTAAIDLADQFARQGWTQDKIDAELARRGLSLPVDNS